MRRQTSSSTGRRSRRGFLKSSAVVAGVAAASQLSIQRSAHAAGGEELKIALLGCGRRGTGAAAQALQTAGPIKLWAMADAFGDRLDVCLENLTSGANVSQGSARGLAEKIDVSPERRFVGLDAYQKAIDSGADVIVDASPPAFRPHHFAAAVAAGKHVFMEKPLAVDAPGVRKLLAAGREADEKGLKVGVGLQRHHQRPYIDTIKRIKDGALGKLLMLRAYWNTANPAKTPPDREGLSEMEYQLRDWYFFTWLSGDHICEQHIHNLDVCNWIMDDYPAEANGMGGRQVRTSKDYGHIFDHHAIEFTYPDGTKMFSQSRQIPGCWRAVSEHAHGTRGTCNVSKYAFDIEGQEPQRLRPPRGQKWANPYQVEHDELFDAIRNNRPYNESEYGALSTMTAIFGRMATYSGKVVTWDEAINSELSLWPERLAWDATPPVLPDDEGFYPVAMPGATRAW